MLTIAMGCLVGCGIGDTWRESWRAARTPDRHLRLGGAQIPTEVIEGLAMRCESVPFVVQRVGKIRFSHDGFRGLVKGNINVACTSCKIPAFDAKDYHDAHGHLPRGWRMAWDARSRSSRDWRRPRFAKRCSTWYKHWSGIPI